MRRVLLLTTAVVFCAATAAPQAINPGDLLISEYSQVLNVQILDRATGARRNLMKTSAAPDDVIMARNNIDVITCRGSGSNRTILTVTPSGTATTIAVVPGVSGLWVGGFELDQDGSVIVASPNGSVYRAQTSGSYSTLTVTGRSIYQRVDIDPSDGSYVLLSQFNAGQLLAIDRTTNVYYTIATGLGAITDVVHDMRTDAFWVSSTSAGVRLVDRTGFVLTTLTPGFLTAVEVDQENGHVFTATGGTVSEYDPQGTRIKTWQGPGFFATGIEIYGSRKLAPGSDTASAKPGSRYPFVVNFLESPGAGYCCALSLRGHFPGIFVGGGRRVPINPDAVFNFTACNNIPGLTLGFLGILDGSGSASGWFMIPSGIPPGTLFTLAAVAINPKKPQSLDIAASMSIVVE